MEGANEESVLYFRVSLRYNIVLLSWNAAGASPSDETNKVDLAAICS